MAEQVFQQINRLRKSGELDAAWELGCTTVQQNPSDSFLKGAFFWVCYAYLKDVRDTIKARAAAGKSEFTPTRQEAERIDFLLDWIIWLDLPDSVFEYRSLLLIFQANLEHFPKLMLLLAKHAKTLFSPEDKQPFITEKGESPSLMLKFTRKLAKTWSSQTTLRHLSVDDLITLLTLTRHEVKDTQQLIWLDYDEARCLIVAKRYEEARKRILAVLRKKQNEAWAWGALATTYRQKDPQAAITLFAKALSCAHDDALALPTLKGFAVLLAAEGLHNEASICVHRAVNCYLHNGWQIKTDLEQLLNQPWYNHQVNTELLTSFILQRSQNAADYLFGERVQKLALVQNIHAGNRGFHAWVSRNQSLSVRMKLWSDKLPLSPGDYVQLTIAEEDQSVVAVAPAQAQPLTDAGEIEDILRVTEKGFAFVGDTFVPKDLVPAGMDGQKVHVVRVVELDKTKNRYGWRALKVIIS